MEFQSLEYYGVTLTVGYIVYGKYIPATRYEPEEHPDYIIKEICVGDVNIAPILLEEQVEEIYNLLIDKL